MKRRYSPSDYFIVFIAFVIMLVASVMWWWEAGNPYP